MKRRRNRARLAVPAAPGVLHTDPSAPMPSMRLVSVGASGIIDREIKDLSEFVAERAKSKFTWINVGGLGDGELILQLGKLLGLHILALEDVVNVHQRAKVEHYSDHLFVVLNRPLYGERSSGHRERFVTEQITLFIGKGFLVTFRERKDDFFQSVIDRIHKHSQLVMAQGVDYLVYMVMDAVIDAYFPLLEVHADHIDALEEVVKSTDYRGTTQEIHHIRSELLLIRRALSPHREVMSQLLRESGHFAENTMIFVRDCQDHVMQLLDMVEAYKDSASELMDLYLSISNHQINEVIKMLTVVTTIFIPLTFITSLYGMNFNTGTSPWNMPELNSYWGYPIILVLMLGLTGAQVYFFKKRGWLKYHGEE